MKVAIISIFRGCIFVAADCECAVVLECDFVACDGGAVDGGDGVGGRAGVDIVAVDDLNIFSHVHSHIRPRTPCDAADSTIPAFGFAGDSFGAIPRLCNVTSRVSRGGRPPAAPRTRLAGHQTRCRQIERALLVAMVKSDLSFWCVGASYGPIGRFG